MARYWEKRSIDLEKLIQEKNDKTIIKVNRYYENVFKELNAQIGKIFSKYATEGQMTIEDALKLLNTQQTKEVYNTLKRIYDRTDNEDIKQDILNRLNAPAYAARIARIEAMRDLIYSEAQNIGWATEMALQARMIDTYQTSFYQTHYTIQKGTGLAYDFNKLSNPAVKAAIANEWKGANYSKRIWNNTDKLANDLEEILTQGLMIGISGKKMATRIVKKIDSGRYEANRLIRTEVNYIAGQARLKCYEDIGTEKYIFIATLDTRTSVQCQKLDKTIHLVKDAEVGVNYPPMHPNCRSVDSAYIEGKDYSKLKRRARNPITGKTELVPADMTYGEWKKKYIDLKNDSEYQNAKERAGGKNIEKLHSSDIMKSKEIFRKMDDTREGFKFISDKTFDKLTIQARKNGAIILRGTKEVEEHLDKMGAAASNIGDILLFRENVCVSEVLEETYHFEQNKVKLNNDKKEPLRTILNEIDAKQYLLENASKYQIPRKEVELTQKQLESYKNQLKKYK